MSWLTSSDIDTRLIHHKLYKGVYPIDGLPSTFSVPAFFVINTHTHNLPGEHWKAIYIDDEMRGEVFDSLALPISNTIIRFMNLHTRQWKSNKKAFQHPLSAKCGVYIIYYVTKRLLYPSLDEFCKSFSVNPVINEHKMLNFYRK